MSVAKRVHDVRHCGTERYRCGVLCKPSEVSCLAVNLNLDGVVVGGCPRIRGTRLGGPNDKHYSVLGTLVGGPNDKHYSVLGTFLGGPNDKHDSVLGGFCGSPVLGNYHLRRVTTRLIGSQICHPKP